MTYTENNRITHRQLYRQICLVFTGPFLLCMFGSEGLSGRMGIAGTIAALVLLCFSVIFLVRLAPQYEELGKAQNRVLSGIIGLCFLLYILITVAYLLAVLEKIIPVSLLEGVSGRRLTCVTALICSFGTGKGMQRRGRMAEVSAGILLGSVALMMLLSLGQARADYFRELGNSEVSMAAFLRSMYLYLCAFSGIGLLPFALGEVEKQGSSWKPILLGILTVGAILLGMQLLLPAVFGWKRLLKETCPILPLLAGANLPGNRLARFDVLWMGFVLYGMLFSLGSLFHYGNQVLRITGLLRFHRSEPPDPAPAVKSYKALLQRKAFGYAWWTPLPPALIAWLLSFLPIQGYEVTEYYPEFLAYFFVPALLAIQCFLLVRPVRKGRFVRAAAAICVFGFLTILGGCAGMDPEKRLFPLAIGMDREDSADSGSGAEYEISYGIPNLPQATGQNRPQEDNSTLLVFSGKTYKETEELYSRSQEKYLDLGHLQVLLLGQGIIENQDWDLVLDYLKHKPMVGENVYVFYTENPVDILDWQGGSGTSVGEYLVGILENRTDGRGTPGVTLRQVYHQYEKDGSLPQLPEVRLEGNVLSIDGRSVSWGQQNPSAEDSLSQKEAGVSTADDPRLMAWWGTMYPRFCFMETAHEKETTRSQKAGAEQTGAGDLEISFWLAKVLDWW
ncbi:MAG: GerAB/ArcD/ProY family transporter [Blautia sp.]|nr:GerAB/ArcD/ProY family transporter [Blautia sp.]